MRWQEASGGSRFSAPVLFPHPLCPQWIHLRDIIKIVIRNYKESIIVECHWVAENDAEGL
jgi:hypothetical protein